MEIKVWRPAMAARIAGIFAAVVLAGLGCLLAVASAINGRGFSTYSACVPLAAGAVCAMRYSLMSMISVGGGKVVIMNIFLPKEINIADIAYAKPTYFGVSISLKGGKSATSLVGAQSNIAKVFPSIASGTGKIICKEIMDQRSRFQIQPGSTG
jgi:hypothetical protein